jgi:hypothetical protein
MVKCGVLFEVLTEFLNDTETSFGFKWQKTDSVSLMVEFRSYLCEIPYAVAVIPRGGLLATFR